MTKEITDIVAAFKQAQQAGTQAALATVVHVEGSSYRRPGARMLVEENGRLTGAISGGCLEGDALRKALQAINDQQNKLVTYNTLDDDDVQFGVQLGCNGIVHILFEPVNATQPNNPIALLEKCVSCRSNVVLGTLFTLKNFSDVQPGTCFFFDGKESHTNLTHAQLATSLNKDAAKVLSGNVSLMEKYLDGALTAFIELVEPAINLVIVGAGNDAIPVVEMAAVLGWQTTVIDGRSTHVNPLRFPKAKKLLVGKPGEKITQLPFDNRTAFVLMTHNYNYDLEMLDLLLQRQCTYIGTLGPKKRLERMLTELEEKGIAISKDQQSTLYGPTGLDIGAETAEEIALSLLAEIKAVFTNRQGASLRYRSEAIHSRSATPLEKAQTAL